MQRRMQTITISLVFLVLVISVESLPISHYYTSAMLADKRGFRSGPKYSHGYGKRTSDIGFIDDKNESSSDTSIENGALADILVNFPSMTRVIVNDLIDMNGDGQVTEKEFRTVFYRTGSRDQHRTVSRERMFGDRQ